MNSEKVNLTMKRTSIWDLIDESKRKKIEHIVKRYKEFLNDAKTEREVVEYVEKKAKENGFVSLDEIEKECKENPDTVLSGKKIYIKNRNKNILLIVIGKSPLSKGFKLIGSHVDSPRLDLKPNPLIEKEKLSLLKTHYYGGIKKYHFVNIPLAIHGVVCKSNGEVLKIKIGENEDEPVFCVNDILVHLAKKVQYERKTPEVIKGEELNILFSSMPIKEENVKKKVKEFALELLHEKYGITEEDLVSSELEAVPAGKMRDVGIDRSMVGGYGQDDRLCGFCSLEAIIEMQNPDESSIVFMADKEEIVSEGNTSMQSKFFSWALAKLISLQEQYNDLKLMDSLMNGKALSSDVSAAINPNFPDVHERQNASRLGYGIAIQKYTGKTGKYNANDSNAEYLALIRKIFNNAGIIWQAGELGKVDEGGGGTIAKYLARLGMEVIDVGPPVLSMHSSFEVSSKADLWMTIKAYKAFFDASL